MKPVPQLTMMKALTYNQNMMKFSESLIKMIVPAGLLCLLFIMPVSAEYLSDRTKLSVFPFRYPRSDSLNINISSALEREFAKYDFIEVVPLDIEDSEIYEIEPAYMWTGIEGAEKQGGIFWNIRRSLIEELRAERNVEFSVIGNVIKLGEKWDIEAHVIKLGLLFSKETRPSFTITTKIADREEIPAKISGMSAAIAEWLRGERVLGRAEEDVKRYLGRIVSHSDTVSAVESYVNEYPESIPLRALLLDLYLKERIKYQQKLLKEALTIIDLYTPRGKSDTRYLLSLSLDPFDVSAEAYEEIKEWDHAITIRNRALTEFPFKKMRHRERLARDHYFMGEAYEEKGHITKALEQYNWAIGYVSADSDYHDKIHDAVKRTVKK
jgi:tetratricopeptide (TPR) repeat protein